MDSKNPLRNDGRENQRKQLAKCVDVLAKYFEKWSRLPGSNQVSKGQIVIYAEALADLSPEALEYGCMEATRTAERFPWPGHIRKGADGYRPAQDRSEFLGPALDWNPELEKERLVREEAFKRALTNGEVQQEEQKPEPRKRVVHVTKPIEEQKEELRKRGWLQ